MRAKASSGSERMSSVDVVIPSYNYARYLPVCVKSVLEQEGVDVRVLILDDCSTDNTPEVGAQLAKDPRVEYRRHVKNMRHIATYNEGLMGWASADYCLLLSADDALAPGSLRRATQVMNEHPEVSMVYGMAEIIGEAPELPAAPSGAGELQLQIISGARFLHRCCEFGNPVPTPAAVVRTNLQRELGGYRPEYPHTGDMEMWMRFASRGSIGILQNLQAYYRKHGSNMSTKYYAQLLSDRRERLEVVHDIGKRVAAQVPEFSGWLNDMKLRLAHEALWVSSAAFDAGDASASKECIAFAEQTDPNVRSLKVWRHLRMKRMLGVSAWKALRPVFDRVRGIENGNENRWLKDGGSKSGSYIGWWPQSST
jgi:glycosyltransferase involved in cell wall biosynthesis